MRLPALALLLVCAVLFSSRAGAGPAPQADVVGPRLATLVGVWSSPPRWSVEDFTKASGTHRIVDGPGDSFLWSAEWGSGNVLWHAQIWKTEDGTWRLHMLGMHGQSIDGTVTAMDENAVALSWPKPEGRAGFVAWMHEGSLRSKYVTWGTDGATVAETEVGEGQPPLRIR